MQMKGDLIFSFKVVYQILNMNVGTVGSRFLHNMMTYWLKDWLAD